MTRRKSRQKLGLIVAAAIPVSLCASINAETWHVDDDGPGGNGLTWLNAMDDLQVALGMAAAGDTIKVAQGTYKPGIGQAVSFDIPLEVVLEGGYIGWDEPDPEIRDPALYETILSGDIDNNDVNSPAQKPGDIVGFNSFHVLTIINIDEPDPQFFLTVVDGVTITAGNANGIFDSERVGGGAYVADLKIIVPDLFEGPMFRNCTFVGNRSEDVGGALACLDVGVEVRDCLILNNETLGGQFFKTPGAYAIEGGGGISGLAPFVLVNSRIIGNLCAGQGGGGGVKVKSTANAEIVLASCFFAGNRALEELVGDPPLGGQGGGATLEGGEVMNCVFTGNLADIDGIAGGGLRGATDVYLSTFYGNDAPNGTGGGVAFLGMGGSITNSIAWANTDSVGIDWRQQIFSPTGICPTWCNIEDWDCGVGQCVECNFNNICADPYFVDAENDDLHLALNSPSIDKGRDAFPANVPEDSGDVDDDGDDTQELPWDLDKLPRKFDAVPGTPNRIDQGAYEVQSLACPWDLNGNGMVSAFDMLLLLANWGQSCNHADFDGNDDVGASDLLALLANWGLCPGESGSEPPSLQDELDAACLSSADWQEFLDAMETGSSAEQQNYICWLTHYFEDCTRCICIGQSGCPGADPFDD